MRYCATVVLTTLQVLWVGVVSAADVYEIDAAHTTVGFSVTHLMISRVQGTFKEFTGTIEYDEQDVTKSSVSGSIKVASIDTDIAKRDEHLRNADFFDATQFPEITFKSTRVEKDANGTVCVGNFTMKGVTREVRIPFTVMGKIKDPWGGTRLGLEASLTINRQDYGVAFSKAMEGGGLVVGNEVKITIAAEALLKQ